MHILEDDSQVSRQSSDLGGLENQVPNLFPSKKKKKTPLALL